MPLLSRSKIAAVALAAFLTFGCFLQTASAAGTTNWRIEILPVCGNGIVESGEQCDGENLGGASCAGQGFMEGTLSCLANCSGFVTSACVPNPGGGGGSPPVAPTITAMFVRGWAYPLSIVTLLKDGHVAATAPTDWQGAFLLSVSGLSGGKYMFGVQARDPQGVTSSTVTFASEVAYGTSVYVSNVFLAPTLSIDPRSAMQGELVKFSGYSAPNAEVTLATYPDKVLLAKVVSDARGSYAHVLQTKAFKPGRYEIIAKSAMTGLASDISKVEAFTLRGDAEASAPPPAPRKGDLNGDARVDLVDFSILSFWFKKTLSPEMLGLERELFNGDGRIDLVDFSILAYAWTG